MSDFTKKRYCNQKTFSFFVKLAFFSTKFHVRNLEMCLLKKNVIIREGEIIHYGQYVDKKEIVSQENQSLVIKLHKTDVPSTHILSFCSFIDCYQACFVE